MVKDLECRCNLLKANKVRWCLESSSLANGDIAAYLRTSWFIMRLWQRLWFPWWSANTSCGRLPALTSLQKAKSKFLLHKEGWTEWAHATCRSWVRWITVYASRSYLSGDFKHGCHQLKELRIIWFILLYLWKGCNNNKLQDGPWCRV